MSIVLHLIELYAAPSVYVLHGVGGTGEVFGANVRKVVEFFCGGLHFLLQRRNALKAHETPIRTTALQ
jgi:hypothetical protein